MESRATRAETPAPLSGGRCLEREAHPILAVWGGQGRFGRLGAELRLADLVWRADTSHPSGCEGGGVAQSGATLRRILDAYGADGDGPVDAEHQR